MLSRSNCHRKKHPVKCGHESRRVSGKKWSDVCRETLWALQSSELHLLRKEWQRHLTKISRRFHSDVHSGKGTQHELKVCSWTRPWHADALGSEIFSPSPLATRKQTSWRGYPRFLGWTSMAGRVVEQLCAEKFGPTFWPLSGPIHTQCQGQFLIFTAAILLISQWGVSMLHVLGRAVVSGRGVLLLEMSLWGRLQSQQSAWLPPYGHCDPDSLLQVLRWASLCVSPCAPTEAHRWICLAFLQGNLVGNLAGVLQDYIGPTNWRPKVWENKYHWDQRDYLPHFYSRRIILGTSMCSSCVREMF